MSGLQVGERGAPPVPCAAVRALGWWRVPDRCAWEWQGLGGWKLLKGIWVSGSCLEPWGRLE